MHDPELKDNPPAAPSNKPKTRSFDFQRRLHNQSHPDIPAFVERIRALVDQYGNCFTVAEVGGDNAEREMKLFTSGNNRLNSAYGFNFLYADRLTPKLVREAIEAWPDTPDMGWPSWAFENHDAARAVSRWTSPENARAFSNLKMLLLIALRGNIFVYQGEELGLTQVDIPFEKLQDPEAIANWPLTLSRDGARTPMPWLVDQPNCGFSDADPWLPLGPDHADLAVDCQERDPASRLALTRHLVAFRAANPALLSGAIKVIEAHDNLLVFERQANDQRLLCAFNFGASALAWSPAQPDRWHPLEEVNGASITMLQPFAGLVAEQIA
jgi:alpha-glucosidase